MYYVLWCWSAFVVIYKSDTGKSTTFLFALALGFCPLPRKTDCKLLTVGQFCIWEEQIYFFTSKRCSFFFQTCGCNTDCFICHGDKIKRSGGRIKFHISWHTNRRTCHVMYGGDGWTWSGTKGMPAMSPPFTPFVQVVWKYGRHNLLFI